MAVAEGLADVVEALIRLAPSTQLLSIQNNQGYSPLHIAVLKNQPAFVRRLVVAGARLELRDGEGHSPLHLAARRGYVECAEALLKPVAVHEVGHGGGLRVHAAVQQIDILDQRNTNGEHSVHLATMGGHVPFLGKKNIEYTLLLLLLLKKDLNPVLKKYEIFFLLFFLNYSIFILEQC